MRLLLYLYISRHITLGEGVFRGKWQSHQKVVLDGCPDASLDVLRYLS